MGLTATGFVCCSLEKFSKYDWDTIWRIWIDWIEKGFGLWLKKKKKIDTISRNILKTKRPFSFCSHNGRRKYQKRSTSRALLAINQR